MAPQPHLKKVPARLEPRVYVRGFATSPTSDLASLGTIPAATGTNLPPERRLIDGAEFPRNPGVVWQEIGRATVPPAVA